MSTSSLVAALLEKSHAKKTKHLVVLILLLEELRGPGVGEVSMTCTSLPGEKEFSS